MKWTALLAGGFAGPEVPNKRNDEGMRMSFFDKVKGALTSGREELTRQVGRYKNKKFMQGTVAVCARIAVASDGVSSEEKQKMIGFLRSSEELKVFDTAEVIEFF